MGINKLDFKFILSNLIKGDFKFGDVAYKGKSCFGILDKYSKTPIFTAMGIKDSMILCEILCYLTVQNLPKDIKEDIKVINEEISDYIDLGEHCSSIGVIGHDLENYPNSLLAFDNNNLNFYAFYLRNGKETEEVKISRKCKIDYVKCWTFITSQKGQSRMAPVYSFETLQKWFNETEILYICYIMQYSAKTWCKELLKKYSELSVKL